LLEYFKALSLSAAYSLILLYQAKIKLTIIQNKNSKINVNIPYKKLHSTLDSSSSFILDTIIEAITLEINIINVSKKPCKIVVVTISPFIR
jgi:hypothetical protein